MQRGFTHSKLTTKFTGQEAVAGSSLLGSTMGLLPELWLILMPAYVVSCTFTIGLTLTLDVQRAWIGT